EQPAPADAAPAATAPASLTEAVAAYETAVADFQAPIAAGGDASAVAQAATDAEAEMRGICEALGQPDLQACLSGFGLQVELIDVQAASDSGAVTEPTPELPTEEAPAQEAPAEEAPAEEGAIEEAPAEEVPAEELADDIVLEGDVQSEIVPE